LKDWAKKTEGFSGADLEALVREAAMAALREDMKCKEVKEKNFSESFKKITPSISKEVVDHYNKFVERTKKVKKEEEKVTPAYIG
jgi:transitional endoplasmic reticulum ATPase